MARTRGRRAVTNLRLHAAANAARQRSLRALLTGREPQRDEAGEFMAIGFDGGARQPARSRPETHDQTLTRLFRTGEANAGHRLRQSVGAADASLAGA